MDDKIEIKDLTQGTPGPTDWAIFQEASGQERVLKTPKSELEGTDAFVYIAYADDSDGTGFTLTFNATKNYIAILPSSVEIPSPVVGDFSGLWKNYKGSTGSQGPTGSTGPAGADGDDAYVYIAYASDSSGTGFTMTFNSALDYIAIKTTTTAIVSPVVSDFTGLWKNYKGATGATGPQGPQGDQGIQGNQGVQGPQGNQGVKGDTGDIGITWQGAWSAGTYVLNDGVSHNGSSWIATTTTTEEPSISATDWDLLALKGTDGVGTGDVNGPATNTADYLPQWDGTDSKTLKNGLAVPAGGLAGLTALGLKQDTSNLSTNVTTDGASDTKYPSVKAIKDYADGLVAGLLDYRGGYDASGNAFPTTGGSGTAGAVLKGDMWIISVTGTLGGEIVQVGDSVIANVDTPGQTAGNWNILNSNITYVPENVANKENTTLDTSTTKYPTNRLVKEYVDGKVEDSITDGHTTIAPSGNAVFDALALKSPLANPTFTGTVTLPKTLEIQDTSADHQYVLAVSELTADRTVTLPLLTGNDEFVFKAHTQTFTNKRNTKRAPAITQHATPTINTDITDVAHITGLAQAITSMTTNLSGTPVEGDTLRIDITDNGTARAIAWGTSFEDGAVTLPTTTVVSTRLDIGFYWNTVTSKWRCMAKG